MQIEYRCNKNSEGFTLIELLVVIAIIGLLATIVMINLNSTRDKAKIAKAKAEISQIVTSINLLSDDTGKWPGGCPADKKLDNSCDNSSSLFFQHTGTAIVHRPLSTDNSLDCPSYCKWDDADIAKWKSPYFLIEKDSWGNDYMFTYTDYPIFRQNPAIPATRCQPANSPNFDPIIFSYLEASHHLVYISSRGPDGINNCDDIVKVFQIFD